MKRKASAVWQGGLKDGKGTISAESGVLANTPYNFAKRFEDEKGTNPEELIAAAHSSCFAMATSAQLDGVGIKAQSISATATVALEKVGDGFSVTTSHLEVTIKAPGADRAKVQTAEDNAKAGCQISKLLNEKITMEEKIEVKRSETSHKNHKEHKNSVFWCFLWLFPFSIGELAQGRVP